MLGKYRAWQAWAWCTAVLGFFLLCMYLYLLCSLLSVSCRASGRGAVGLADDGVGGWMCRYKYGYFSRSWLDRLNGKKSRKQATCPSCLVVKMFACG